MRVAFAAALAGLIGLVWIFGAKKGYDPASFSWALTVAVKTAGQVPHSKVTSQALSLIPTLILIGYLAYYAGLTKALFEAAKRWVGWLPGGLGVATVFATAGFAAVSGASVATSAVFARIAIPGMLELGYDRRFAAGVVAAGGTLASLISPSATLVIYAIIVEQDVGRLLLAGFVPGAVSALIFGDLVAFMAVAFKRLGPPVRGFAWGERLRSLPPALPIVFVVVIIICFIYNPFGGDAWGTPTEGGALGAFVVFCMALLGGMRWQQFRQSLLDTAKLSAMIFTIIWGVLIYVRFLGFADLPGALFRLDHVAGAKPHADTDPDPAGLCGPRHVHGGGWLSSIRPRGGQDHLPWQSRNEPFLAFLVRRPRGRVVVDAALFLCVGGNPLRPLQGRFFDLFLFFFFRHSDRLLGGQLGVGENPQMVLDQDKAGNQPGPDGGGKKAGGESDQRTGPRFGLQRRGLDITGERPAGDAHDSEEPNDPGQKINQQPQHDPALQANARIQAPRSQRTACASRLEPLAALILFDGKSGIPSESMPRQRSDGLLRRR